MDKKIKVLCVPSDKGGCGLHRSLKPHLKLDELYSNEFDVTIEYKPNWSDLDKLKENNITNETEMIKYVYLDLGNRFSFDEMNFNALTYLDTRFRKAFEFDADGELNLGVEPSGRRTETWFKGYKYPHDYPGRYVEQQYLPNDVKNKKYYYIIHNLLIH